jgi:hypothetical protein
MLDYIKVSCLWRGDPLAGSILEQFNTIGRVIRHDSGVCGVKDNRFSSGRWGP